MNKLESEFYELLSFDSIQDKEISVNGITYHFNTIEALRKAMQDTIKFKSLNKLAYFILLHKKHEERN